MGGVWRMRGERTESEQTSVVRARVKQMAHESGGNEQNTAGWERKGMDKAKRSNTS